jgi:hypothetical protein
LKQAAEIQSLRELILVKDNRIHLLEDELCSLKTQSGDQDNKLAR